jgi:DNA-binding MarR family transcriptional regulator
MYRIVMEEVAQGTDATAVPAGPGCGDKDERPGVDAAQIDIATGLARLTFLVQGIYARVSERHDLTPVQARLLRVVADGPRGMADLANCFGVEKAALTGLVDRAERRGLVERTSVPGDRRALRVTPTEAGCQAVTAFKAEAAAELGRLVSGLSPHDREHLRRALAMIVTAYEQPSHQRQPKHAQP